MKRLEPIIMKWKKVEVMQKVKKNLFFMLDIDKTLRLANMLANVNM